QEPEEQIALDVYRRLATQHPRLRLVLVPRHPERFDAVAKLLDASNLSWHRRSQLTTRSSLLSPILLVDTIGELGAWWGTAQIAFVGGSFGNRGGQNMIEPAAYGAAVSFGPNTWNFRDIVAALVATDSAVVVRDAAELDNFVCRAVADPAWAAALGASAQAFVRTQLGATGRTLELIETLLQPADQASEHRSAA
ncbi:MAG: 3-deoxy-D-manno-octulosonic acid transferase, partial [Pirellulales bacterium]